MTCPDSPLLSAPAPAARPLLQLQPVCGDDGPDPAQRHLQRLHVRQGGGHVDSVLCGVLCGVLGGWGGPCQEQGPHTTSGRPAPARDPRPPTAHPPHHPTCPGSSPPKPRRRPSSWSRRQAPRTASSKTAAAAAAAARRPRTRRPRRPEAPAPAGRPARDRIGSRAWPPALPCHAPIRLLSSPCSPFVPLSLPCSA